MTSATLDDPITPEQFRDQILDLMEGNFTEEEERERDAVLASDEDLLSYFLLRCALRRCMRMELEIKRIKGSTPPPAQEC